MIKETTPNIFLPDFQISDIGEWEVFYFPISIWFYNFTLTLRSVNIKSYSYSYYKKNTADWGKLAGDLYFIYANQLPFA